MNTYNLDAVNPLKAKDGIVDNPTDVIYLPKQYQYSFYNQIVTAANVVRLQVLQSRGCGFKSAS